jgi:hypothetical protein
MLVLKGIKEELAERVKNPDTPSSVKLSEKLDQLYKENLSKYESPSASAPLIQCSNESSCEK